VVINKITNTKNGPSLPYFQQELVFGANEKSPTFNHFISRIQADALANVSSLIYLSTPASKSKAITRNVPE